MNRSGRKVEEGDEGRRRTSREGGMELERKERRIHEWKW